MPFCAPAAAASAVAPLLGHCRRPEEGVDWVQEAAVGHCVEVELGGSRAAPDVRSSVWHVLCTCREGRTEKVIMNGEKLIRCGYWYKETQLQIQHYERLYCSCSFAMIVSKGITCAHVLPTSSTPLSC